MTASAEIIDGKAFAAGIRARVADEVARLASTGVVPGLAVVLVGADPASQTYGSQQAAPDHRGRHALG